MKPQTYKLQTNSPPPHLVKRIKSRLYWQFLRFGFRASRTPMDQYNQSLCQNCHGVGCQVCPQFALQQSGEACGGVSSPLALGSPRWNVDMNEWINDTVVSPTDVHDSQHTRLPEQGISGDTDNVNEGGTHPQAPYQSATLGAPSRRTASASRAPRQSPYPAAGVAVSRESVNGSHSARPHSMGLNMSDRNLTSPPNSSRPSSIRASLISKAASDTLQMSMLWCQNKATEDLKLRLITFGMFPKDESMALDCWLEAQQRLRTRTQEVPNAALNDVKAILKAGKKWRNEAVRSIQDAVLLSFNLDRFPKGEARKNAAKTLATHGTFFFSTVALSPDGRLLEYTDPVTNTEILPMFGEFDHPCLMIALKQLLASFGVDSWNTTLHFSASIFDPIPIPTIAFIATAITSMLNHMADSPDGDSKTPLWTEPVEDKYMEVYRNFVTEYGWPEYTAMDSNLQKKRSSLFAELSGINRPPPSRLTEDQKEAIRRAAASAMPTSSGSSV